MINKQSSNDEVLHHLKQTELMLMTSEEEQGLNKILEIEDMLKSPKVNYWIDDGFFSDEWLDSTESLIKDVKRKLLKNHVIKEHLAQCRGFVAYNILMSKLENNDMRLMYQNGEWFFVFLNERKEQESWVNQRFNTCFFNSSYEKKFVELIKETNPLEINKSWIYQREDWFYTAELFEDLNNVCKKTNYDDIQKKKVKSLKIEDDLPPIEDFVEDKSSLSVTETVPEPTLVSQIISSSEDVLDNKTETVEDRVEAVVVEVEEEVKKPMPVHIKSSIKADDNPFGGDDIPFVPDTEELPPIEDIDETGGLFPPQREVIDVVVETQDIPIKVDFAFDESESGSIPVSKEVIKEIKSEDNLQNDVFSDSLSVAVEPLKKQEKSSEVILPVIAKAVSISPVAAKVEKKVAEPETKPVRALFGSRGSMAKKPETPMTESSSVSEPISNNSVPSVEKKKGFAPLLGGRKVTLPLENESYLVEDFSGSDE